MTIKTYVLATRHNSDDIYQSLKGINPMSRAKAEEMLGLAKAANKSLDIVIYNPFCE